MSFRYCNVYRLERLPLCTRAHTYFKWTGNVRAAGKEWRLVCGIESSKQKRKTMSILYNVRHQMFSSTTPHTANPPVGSGSLRGFDTYLWSTINCFNASRTASDVVRSLGVCIHDPCTRVRRVQTRCHNNTCIFARDCAGGGGGKGLKFMHCLGDFN